MTNSTKKSAFLISALLGVCAAANAGTTSYQYDALGRLSVVTEGAAVVRYYYDPAGNRTQKQTQGGAATTIAMPNANLIEKQGSVVLKASVGGSSPGGTVSFYEGGTFLGSTTLTGGTAIVEIIGLTRGSHTITASYSGDVTNASSSVNFQIKIVNLDWLPAMIELLLN